MAQGARLPLFRTFSKSDDETVSAFEVVRKVTNVVLSAIAEYDEKFSFFPVHKSSFLVVKGATHFEIMITLKNLTARHVELDEQNLPPGLTLVNLSQDTTISKWKNFCGRAANGKESLSAKRVCSSFSKLITRLIEDIGSFRSRKGITEDINITNISTEDAVKVNIKLRSTSYVVELVPAIECCGLWPVCANEWRENTAHGWPKQETKKEIVKGGVHLVAKTTKNELHWRIWFCKAERSLLEFKKTQSKQKCLALIKKVIICDLECSILSSYHFQTVFLHECVKFPADGQWTDEKIEERKVSILQSLENCLQAHNCPHFFLPSLNLFGLITDAVLDSLAKKLRGFLQNSFNPLEKIVAEHKQNRNDSFEDTKF